MQQWHERYSETRFDGWQGLCELLEGTQTNHLVGWQSELERRLQDNSATYRNAPQSGDKRDWRMDPVPFMLGKDAWAALESGVVERAGRVERVLGDLMTTQTLLRQNRYDPGLLFADPDYLVGAHKLVPRSQWLRFLAMDVARDAEGQWRVYSDITRPPGGLGYVLERRVNLARVLGFMTRRLPLRRLVGFLTAFREALEVEADERGLSLMLTPGQHHPSYFEHAYLANYLDLTLAQGDDLTVREGRVYLKTLKGLEPVAVVLRRVLDSFVDPLAFKDDSQLGTPGLAAVVRNNQLRAWNPPGAGLIDSPGFLSQLDGCFDTPFKLPSAVSLPLNQPEHLAAALASPEDYIFRPLGSLGREGLLYSQGDEGLASIAQRPDYWVAQRKLVGSQVPALIDGQLTPVHAGLRLYAIKTAEGWQAMPGGLVRHSQEEFAPIQASNQRADGVKDLWVLGESAEEGSLLSGSTAKPEPVQGDHETVPSRIADALFWSGRYIERLDFICRLLREVLQRVADERAKDESDYATVGLDLLMFGGAFGSEAADTDNPELSLEAILTDPEHPVGLHWALNGLLTNARSAPDYMTADAWRLLARLEKNLKSAVGLSGLPLSGLYDRVDQTLTLLSAMGGLINDTLSRTLGYRFLDIGRYIERGLQTTSIIRQAALSSRRGDLTLWEMVLAATDTAITYKRAYRSALHAGAVVDLLVLDDTTPRALGYHLRRLNEQIAWLPKSNRRGRLGAVQRLAVELRTQLQLVDSTPFMAQDGQAAAGLYEQLNTTGQSLLALSEALTLQYFNHAEVPNRLTKVTAS